ncbi:DUF945 family protein, partial [Enterobacter hormaechei]|uniref:DUF945 family protein n=1 Tax=Enterobacter hormaechei TaxID=158836 RepID=UPI001F0A17FD
AQANAQLKLTAPESNLEVSYQNYHRGVFSSQLQLLVKPIAGKVNPWIKSGQSVIFNESVDHGPAQANAQLKLTAPESNLEVSYQNYHRGVFSSQL